MGDIDYKSLIKPNQKTIQTGCLDGLVAMTEAVGRIFVYFRQIYPYHPCIFTYIYHMLLGGGFNPFEKYLSNWKSSPNRGEKYKIFETTT